MVTLRTAITQCERFYGAAWYFSPQRWGTADGYAPYHEVIRAWRRMVAVMAFERLSAAQVALLARREPDDVRRLLADEQRTAFPDEEHLA